MVFVYFLFRYSIIVYFETYKKVLSKNWSRALGVFVLLALEGVVAGGTIGVGVVTNGGTTGLGKGVGTGGTIGQ